MHLGSLSNYHCHPTFHHIAKDKKGCEFGIVIPLDIWLKAIVAKKQRAKFVFQAHFCETNIEGKKELLKLAWRHRTLKCVYNMLQLANRIKFQKQNRPSQICLISGDGSHEDVLCSRG